MEKAKTPVPQNQLSFYLVTTNARVRVARWQDTSTVVVQYDIMIVINEPTGKSKLPNETTGFANRSGGFVLVADVVCRSILQILHIVKYCEEHGT